MSSWKQRKEREARGATLFMWLRIIGVALFFGAIFLFGGNPFTGELPEDQEVGANPPSE